MSLLSCLWIQSSGRIQKVVKSVVRRGLRVYMSAVSADIGFFY